MVSQFIKSLVPSTIPSEWTLPSIGDVLTGSDYGLTLSTIEGGNVPIIGMKDLVAGRVDTSSLAHVEGEIEDYNGSILQENDVLLNRTNSPALVGKVSIFSGEIECIFASYLVRLTVNAKKVVPTYLNYWLNSEIAQKALKRISTRAVSQANINPTEFKLHCPIILPPLPEQRRIAEILSVWDEAIDKTEQLIKAKEQRQIALTNLLVFGRTRISSFRKNGLIEKHRWFSYPSDWKNVAIGEIAQEVSIRNESEKGRTVLSCSKYDGFVESLRYFKKQVFSNDTSNYKLVKRGEFGYPSNHIEEGSIGLQHVVDEGIVSPIYTVFAVDESNVHAGFLYRLFKTSIYRHIFKVSTSSSVDRRGSLRWSEFSKIRVPLPALDEQKAIDKILNEAADEIAALARKRDALKRQKRGLMQKLLTGQWRVKMSKTETGEIENA